MWSTDPCTRIGQVGLSPIFHPALYRDLAEVCTRVTETASLLPDGRRLLLCLRGDGHQGLTPPSIPAHLDEEPIDTLQWKRASLFHLR